MYRSIKKLDPLLSSQIAAGEVIERPASVVKELVENSIDAGAGRISIDILDGGMKLIRVCDDGTGMSHEDALLSLERFATSKIGSMNDFESIETLGFRGEALPSIASCSKLSLETKINRSETGICLRVEGGELIDATEKGLPPGTTFTVRDLFFNTPARFKFMKSRGTERNAVIETVERLSLAWPNISFTLTSQGRVALHTSGNGLKDALANIFGPETADSMVEISSKHEGLEIAGFAGLPRVYRRSRDRQLFSVNQRPIKNPALGWALDHAYAGLLPPKSYAVAFIEITLEPGRIDINVHPTKSEIRFGNEAEVKRAVTQSVRDALARAGYLSKPGRNPRAEGGGTPATYVLSKYASQSIYPGRQVDKKPSERQPSSLFDTRHETGTGLLSDGVEPPCEWHCLGTLQDVYLVAKTPDSLLIIDQHALAESLAYQSLCQGESSSQELLIPEIIQLEPREAILYKEHEDGLESVGFSVRPIGTRTVLVTKVPLILGQALPADSLKQVLLAAYESSGPDMPLERAVAQAQIATAACHASVKGKQPLRKQEALALIQSLWANPAARTCPHGRPTVYVLPYDEIDRFFGR
ncbi:MAG TPA: DNA mismatch repair endonuclease MutL [Firmicutes bacterium]|nr:DNA mismatch repair endonuclease MutL [Candidatus Fermentithermobacillaceae bacterium]